MGLSVAFSKAPFPAGHVPSAIEREARMAVGAGVSLLLIGEQTSVLAAILGCLPQPIVTSLRGEPLALPPSGRGGTLLIPDVDCTTALEQRRLLDWLGASGRGMQVVSTAAASLLPRVEAGDFLEALYYRLNVVCIDTAARSPGAETCGVAADVSFEWPRRR